MNQSLSKSKYLSGLQCSKLLWHQYNAPQEIPPPDASTQAIFDTGNEIGELAQKLFPCGEEVAWNDGDFQGTLSQTQELIKKRNPVYEASFSANSAYARADILLPVGRSAWDIIEVKSSTGVKDINISDVAFQKYCYESTGLKISKCHLMHVNNEYVRQGELNPKELFAIEDVSEAVSEKIPQVPRKISEMLEVIKLKACPNVCVGIHCTDPYVCPLYDKCHTFLPEHNPLNLYRFSKKKAYKLIRDGILDISKLPEGTSLNDKQSIQIDCIRQKKEFINKQEIQDFLKGLRYPLYFLDFETYAFAVPPFDGTKPYQQIPFQFSLHIQDSKDSGLVHHSFLAEGKNDPRPKFIERLREVLGENGDIIAYNAPFEMGRLKECGKFMSEHKPWILTVNARFVDLLKPFRDFNYYNPKQHGSNSIKAVLPALVGKSYEGMEISEGGTASREYVRVAFGDITPEDRAKVRKALEEYCKLDTKAMVDIINKLKALLCD